MCFVISLRCFVIVSGVSHILCVFLVFLHCRGFLVSVFPGFPMFGLLYGSLTQPNRFHQFLCLFPSAADGLVFLVSPLFKSICNVCVLVLICSYLFNVMLFLVFVSSASQFGLFVSCVSVCLSLCISFVFSSS